MLVEDDCFPITRWGSWVSWSKQLHWRGQCVQCPFPTQKNSSSCSRARAAVRAHLVYLQTLANKYTDQQVLTRKPCCGRKASVQYPFTLWRFEPLEPLPPHFVGSCPLTVHPCHIGPALTPSYVEPMSMHWHISIVRHFVLIPQPLHKNCHGVESSRWLLSVLEQWQWRLADVAKVGGTIHS